MLKNKRHNVHREVTKHYKAKERNQNGIKTESERNQNYLSYPGKHGRPPSVVGTELPSEIVHEHSVQNAFGETIPALRNMSMVLNKRTREINREEKKENKHLAIKRRKEIH